MVDLPQSVTAKTHENQGDRSVVPTPTAHSGACRNPDPKAKAVLQLERVGLSDSPAPYDLDPRYAPG